MPPLDLNPAPSTWRDLWRAINAPQPFDRRPVRVACCLLLVAFAIIAVVRHHPEHPEFIWIRAAICFYAGLGAWLAPRITWTGLRHYTRGLAVILPLAAAYVDGVLGHDVSQLPLTVLATFIPLAFLQTGTDLVVATACIALGDAALLAWLPSPAVTLSTVVIVLAGTTATGIAASLTVLVYRARLHLSLTRLEAALRTKGEFLNTMSHELRSPLHVIIGYTDMVREQSLPAEALHPLDRVRAAAIELLQLVENTMNAARLEAGKMALRVEEFAPADLARDLAESVSALPESSTGVPVRWDVAPELPHVRLDRLKVKEIVQNLVSNALKFTHAGEVRVRMERAGDRLRISVRDTGVGIPREAHARIFGMFERVEEVGAAPRTGVGLGLYIVTRLIALMRGRAELESTPGTGSCFTVDLPLQIE